MLKIGQNWRKIANYPPQCSTKIGTPVLNKHYNNAIKVNDKQRQEIWKPNQCTDDLKKQRSNEEFKVNKFEQYDRGKFDI